MDIQSIDGIRSEYINDVFGNQKKSGDQTFGTIFNSALNMLNETNNLQNTAE